MVLERERKSKLLNIKKIENPNLLDSKMYKAMLSKTPKPTTPNIIPVRKSLVVTNNDYDNIQSDTLR
jgi:hypothetical protein